MYARFDDSTKDFPIDTTFAQVGVIKNPETYAGAGTTFTEDTFSSLGAIMLNDAYSGTPVIGSVITQVITNGDTAKAYVASYDKETKVLKYYQDRSLYLNQTTGDHTGSSDVASRAKVVSFVSSSSDQINISGIGATMNVNQDQNYIMKNNKKIDLGVTFTGGLADSQINKKTGDIIYIDNRPSVTRDSRQKEDVKIILEF
jgi:hypothetical protein